MLEIVAALGTFGAFLVAFVLMILTLIDRHKAKETVRRADEALAKAKEGLKRAEELKDDLTATRNTFLNLILIGFQYQKSRRELVGDMVPQAGFVKLQEAIKDSIEPPGTCDVTMINIVRALFTEEDMREHFPELEKT